jgi:RNA 3'-terminal phosphate cyclase (ATP)
MTSSSCWQIDSREKPGLLRQHLTAVKAAEAICGAEVVGAEIGSRELTFRPGEIRPGAHSFAIGTAGSCTLVLQTVLPPLITASGPSTVRISGGTHNKASPPFDFLERSFLPLLQKMGAQVRLELRSYGFYPKGGGEIVAHVTPAMRLASLELHTRGERTRSYAEAYVAALPIHIAQRELEVIGHRLNWSPDQLLLRGLPNDMGPGNAVTITIEHANVTEVVTGFGERGVRAEAVAAQAAGEARHYIASSAPVGVHLADQLLLPMALAGSGSFSTTSISQHLRSNALVIGKFTARRVALESTPTGEVVSIR